jgi:hypothetical protein
MARDGSIFNTMFSLPQGDQPAEGVSDATALVLPGERAAEFRAFLWAMYALPPELLSVHAPGADLDRLVSVAAAAAHYGFKAVETWALDALLEHAARKPCPLLGPEPLPPPPARARLRRVVRLAQDCAHARLLDTLVKLLAGLVPRSLPLAYLCMALADDFDLRTLRGHAYLEIMHKDAVTVFRAPADPDTSEPGTPVPAFWEPGEVDASGRLVITTGQVVSRFLWARVVLLIDVGSTIACLQASTSSRASGSVCGQSRRRSSTRRAAGRRGTNTGARSRGSSSGRRRPRPTACLRSVSRTRSAACASSRRSVRTYSALDVPS